MDATFPELLESSPPFRLFKLSKGEVLFKVQIKVGGKFCEIGTGLYVLANYVNIVDLGLP